MYVLLRSTLLFKPLFAELPSHSAIGIELSCVTGGLWGNSRGMFKGNTETSIQTDVSLFPSTWSDGLFLACFSYTVAVHRNVHLTNLECTLTMSYP